MSTDAAVAWDIEVTSSGGVVFGLMLKSETDDRGYTQHKTLDQQLTALLEKLPMSQKLLSIQQDTWVRGIGLDYNWAPGVYTRSDGYALPAGGVVQAGVQGRANGTGVAFAEYGGDLWIATNLSTGTGMVNRNTGGASAGGANDFATGLTLGAGEFVRDLIVADNGSGTSFLYASSSDANGLTGRMHRWDGPLATNWTSTASASPGPPAFGAANGRNRMAKVFWRGRDGIGYWRLVAVSRAKTLAYTVPNGDPMDAAKWVEAAITIDTAYPLDQLVAFRQHVFATSKENLYDIQEDGAAPGLTSYLPRMIQTGTGVAAEGLDGYVYMSVGRGLERIYVDQPGVLQVNPGQCAPGWGTRAENEARGYVTAICVDQGWVVAAIYNPTVQKTYVCWGKDRNILGIESPNPLIWHGPELVINQDYKITRMWTSGLANDGAPNGDLRLWCSASSVGGTGLLVFYLSLPLAGSPLQDLVSGGQQKFTTGTVVASFLQPYSYLELLPPAWDGTTSIVDQHSLVTRGLSVVRASDGTTTDDGLGTKLTLQTAADPAPGAITWSTATNITTSPSQTVTPTAVKGEIIRRRINFVSPNGGAATPKVGVLDVCRMDYWRNTPTATLIPLDVEYGGGVLNLDNTESDVDPDTITGYLTALVTSGRTTVKTRDGHRWTAKITDVADLHVEYDETLKYGKRVTARVSALFLAQVS